MLTCQFPLQPLLSPKIHISLNVYKQVGYLFIDVLCFKVKNDSLLFIMLNHMPFLLGKSTQILAISYNAT